MGNVVTNNVRAVNVRTAGANLGLKPWTTIDEEEKNLVTGDIILLSAKTPVRVFFFNYF
jgi:hypothetical protein